MSWTNPPKGLIPDPDEKPVAIIEAPEGLNESDVAEIVHKVVREYFPKNAANPAGRKLAQDLANRFYPCIRATLKIKALGDKIGYPGMGTRDAVTAAMKALQDGPSPLPDGIESVTVPSWAGEVKAVTIVHGEPIVACANALFRLDYKSMHLVPLTFREGQVQ